LQNYGALNFVQFFSGPLCKKREVLPKPHGPMGWRWSPFPIALSQTPAYTARPRIRGYSVSRGVSVYSPAFAGTKLYCLVTEAHRCEQLAQTTLYYCYYRCYYYSLNPHVHPTLYINWSASKKMYKVVHGFDDTTGILEFRVNSCTRGAELKIFKPHSNNNVRAHSFACRHVHCWNELP